MSGGRNGIFKDRKGNIRGKLNESATCISPLDCFGIVQNGSSICESCQVFRKSPLTMLSYQNAKKQSQSATNVNSHCPWKCLSTEEVELTREKHTGGETKDGKRNKLLETEIPTGVFLLNPFSFYEVVLILFSETTLIVK